MVRAKPSQLRRQNLSWAKTFLVVGFTRQQVGDQVKWPTSSPSRQDVRSSLKSPLPTMAPIEGQLNWRFRRANGRMPVPSGAVQHHEVRAGSRPERLRDRQTGVRRPAKRSRDRRDLCLHQKHLAEGQPRTPDGGIESKALRDPSRPFEGSRSSENGHIRALIGCYSVKCLTRETIDD